MIKVKAHTRAKPKDLEPRDDLTSIFLRAHEALDQQYPEDRDCMGSECLDMIEELRKLRPIAKAAKQLYKVICTPAATPGERAQALYNVRTVLHANRKRRAKR